MNIELNKLFEKNFLVEKQHSAKNMKSGDLEVLATPSLVAFMEEASKEYLNTFLEDGYGSVGINININHIAPTLIGKTILVKGCIKEIIREKIIIFSLEAFENNKKIGDANHIRAIIDNENFMKKLLDSN
ncbi:MULTISPECIES: thioesterase family protein [Gemella]|uniref:thioesterase family protein n=1 Tax=Gemella TaxID=1378 RepID=UPI0009310E6D|nr:MULTISPECIES: thioesterase family protein [Gemella]AXI27078.1 dihydrolipoamide acyltransferase [Gemella sp. ND 6198]